MRTFPGAPAVAAGFLIALATIAVIAPARAGQPDSRRSVAEAPITKKLLPPPAPAAKPKKSTPAAKTAKAAPAKKRTPAKATPAKATPGKTTPGKTTAAPAKPAGPIERQIGEVVSVDYPDTGELRLDGPWRDRGYPLRYWLTSYVDKTTGGHRHLISVQVTHHDEQPRNYRRGEVESPPVLAVTQTGRPSLQCTRNRDNSRQCFHTESYALDLPEALLDRARKSGLTITLAGDAAEPFLVPVDARTIEAQLGAAAAVTPVAPVAQKQ